MHTNPFGLPDNAKGVGGNAGTNPVLTRVGRGQVSEIVNKTQNEKAMACVGLENTDRSVGATSPNREVASAARAP